MGTPFIWSVESFMLLYVAFCELKPRVKQLALSCLASSVEEDQAGQVGMWAPVR